MSISRARNLIRNISLSYWNVLVFIENCMLCNNYDAVMILSDFNFELGNYYYYYLFITPLRQHSKIQAYRTHKHKHNAR